MGFGSSLDPYIGGGVFQPNLTVMYINQVSFTTNSSGVSVDNSSLTANSTQIYKCYLLSHPDGMYCLLNVCFDWFSIILFISLYVV